MAAWGNAVVPLPQSKRALAAACDEALRAAGGDDAAAARLLLAVLRDVGLPEPGRAPSALERANTDCIQQHLTTQWAQGEAKLERLVLPRFLPFVVDPQQTVAAALGSQRLSRACYRLCSSRPFSALALFVGPVAHALAVGVLSARGAAAHAALPAVWLVCGVALALRTVQVLLLNTEVLRSIVLRSFDIYWALINVLLVAFTGAITTSDPQLRIVWLAAQLQLASLFFQDAAPPALKGRRSCCLALAVYALFNCYAMLAIWTRVFDVRDCEVRVFNIPFSLTRWCFAAQVNAIILSTRFAVRGLVDERILLFCVGLVMVRLPREEARELRAVMLAERQLRMAHASPITKDGALVTSPTTGDGASTSSRSDAQADAQAEADAQAPSVLAESPSTAAAAKTFSL